jgi:hypothetical protein
MRFATGYAQKFPAASVLVKNYFIGNTSLEAYTKSVRWPSQGVFVGDPLARPFGTQATPRKKGGGTITASLGIKCVGKGVGMSLIATQE